MSATNRGGERIEHDVYNTPAWCTRRILEALYGMRAPHEIPRTVIEPCAGSGAICDVVRKQWSEPPAMLSCDVRDDSLEVDGGVFWIRDATQAYALPDWMGKRADLLITNPPFSLAAQIIKAQRDTARVQAYLLRSSFKLEIEESEQQLRNVDGRPKRFAYSFRDDMPDIYQLPERPEFVASDRCAGGFRAIVDGNEDSSASLEYVPCGWSQKAELRSEKPTQCPACGAPRVSRSTTDASEYAWFVWGPQRRREGRVTLLPRTPLSERKADR